MNKKFIAFEGIDGSGKTLLAQMIAEKVQGVYYKCPPEALKPARKAADEGSPWARFYFYLSGNCMASDEIKEILKTKSVICDFYVYSTIAFHSVLLERDVSFPGDIKLPDNIVYTTAPFPLIEKRLSERPIRTKYEQMPFLKQVAKKYDQLFEGMHHVIKIDTSQPIEKSIEQILKKESFIF